jgi:hypothetical protein
MNTFRLILMVGAMIFGVGACGGGSAPAGSAAVESTVDPSVVTSAGTSPAATSVAPAGASAAASSTAVEVPDTCALVTAAEVEAAIGMAVKPGQDVTAQTGWSSACAWVQEAVTGEPTYAVNLKVLAQGTLATFATMNGASPVTGLGDEAYAFDEGRQIAIRFGELVAVVAGARGIDGKGVPATAVEALARLIAARIAG